MDADIKQVFRLFHEISGLNFVLDPGVSGNVTVVLDDGRSFTGNVFAGPKEPINRFTGFGLVNADAAVRRVQHTRGMDRSASVALVQPVESANVLTRRVPSRGGPHRVKTSRD